MSEITEILTRLQGAMSQAEISRTTGIPQPKLSRWFSGKPAAGANAALQLAALDRRISAEKKRSTRQPAKVDVIGATTHVSEPEVVGIHAPQCA